MSKTKKPRATRDLASDAPTQVIETKPTTYDGIRENLEAIIVAFILALVIRHFAVEAFEIPTGSMAPTLYGIHAWVECPNCEDFEFNVGLSSNSTTGQLQWTTAPYAVYRGTCPKCQVPHVRATGPDQPPASGFTVRCHNHGCDASWEGKPSDYQPEKLLVKSFDRPVHTFHCPNCEFEFRDVMKKSSRSGGHKILVNKMAYKLGSPRRWDVIVFQFSEERNYIKRLLGLPGETVSIRGGDLYVKKPGENEFRVQGKTERPDVRDALWFSVNDSDIVERGFNPTPAWGERHEKGSGLTSEASKWWTWKDQSWTVNVPKGRVAILEYVRSCRDWYNYNLLGDRGHARNRENPNRRSSYAQEVGDKKVEFTVHPTEGNASGLAWIGGELRDGEFTYQFRIPVGKASADDKALLTRLPSQEKSSVPDPTRPPTKAMAGDRTVAEFAIPLLKPSRISFWNADDRVAVEVNGEEILALDYISESPDLDNDDEHYLRLLAHNVMADIKSIQVYRDVYYTEFRGPGRAFLRTRQNKHYVQSEEADGHNHYLPCGDNSPSSSDGRAWGTAPERNMMGRAFFIFWPAWPSNFQCGLIR